jgi:hypothetical protein
MILHEERGAQTLTQQTGSALAIKTWAWQLTHGKSKPLPSEKPYPDVTALIDSVREMLEAGKKNAGRSPKVLVIGAVSLVLEIVDGELGETNRIEARTMWQGSRAIGQGCWYSRRGHLKVGFGRDQKG